ncbi:hypothetical protein ACQ4PT_050591 [Festuca glaucescens]
MGKRKGRRPAAKSRSGAGGREPRPASEPEAGTEEEAEGESDLCFVCKDGGDLRLCDYRNCHKAYHPHCVGQDEDFLKSDEEFICRWHKCFICKRRSCFRCLCCPGNSVCRACLRQAEFAQIGNQTKGFCANCLRTAIMIEKNVEVDSDGGKVDFSDKSTAEFLFKDYWEIIKEKEGLTLDNLQEAHASLDNSPNCNRVLYSENSPKEQSSDDDFLGNIDDDDDEPIHLSNGNGSSNKVKASRKKGKSKKNVYAGWGSKELIEFLASIGKDPSKSLDQFGAAEAVKEYIRQKDLSQKDKKKYIKCDGKLFPLFRKKEIRFTKIYSLLERHIAANATSEDETLASSEDNTDSFRKKKSRTMTSEPSTLNGISERYRRCFASLVRDNIKLIYLRRSLVMDLLKQPETFENKVIGCFVRVKNDPKYCTYHRPKTMYQLGQVTELDQFGMHIGIGKSSEEYKIRDVSTNMLLRISSCWSEVKISMLSDEEFEEDECEDLRLLVKKEHSERHTVAELEEKARNVHRDIVSHGIDKELQRLEKLIEVANEKGASEEKAHCFKSCPEDKSKGANEKAVCLKSCSEEKSEATEADACTPGTCVQNQAIAGSEDNAAGDRLEMDAQKKGTEATAAGSTDDVIIIDDDDDEDYSLPDEGANITVDLDANKSRDTHMVQHETRHTAMWYYTDPQDDEQGPFSLEMLRGWKEADYFDDDFRVWRAGQSSDSAILLTDALRLKR